MAEGVVGHQDLVGAGEALHPCRDVDGLPEVVEAIVERDLVIVA